MTASCQITYATLDYRANSYHIHLSILGYHGYGEEISQICPCPFCPINSSFSGTPSPPHHSTTPTLLFWRRHCSRAPRTPTTPKSSIFSPVRKWPSTLSYLRSVLLLSCFYHTPVHPQFILLNIFSSFFSILLFFLPPKTSRICPTESSSLPINHTSNVSVR